MSQRLLFIVNNLDFFISHRLEIGLAAIANGWQVKILGPANAKAAGILLDKGFDVQQLDVAKEDHSLPGQWRFLQAVYRTCRQFRPDLCHMITLKTFLVAGVAARLARVPRRVGSVSGLGFFFISNEFKTRVSRFLYRPLFHFAMANQATEVIFQNDDDRTVLLGYAGVDQGQTHLIPGSGVDLARFSYQPEPSTPVVFLLIGRMLKDKGVLEFVEAARILHEQGLNARFLLVGNPDKTNPASLGQAQLEAWHEEGLVEWLGYCEDIPAIITSAHILVLPSYREGFPRVLIEAAASGRPSITTDVPGCRDAIIPDQTGLLVPVCNSQALAKAMGYLAEDKPVRVEMGMKARQLAEKKYAIESVVSTHMKIYNLGNKG